MESHDWSGVFQGTELRDRSAYVLVLSWGVRAKDIHLELLLKSAHDNLMSGSCRRPPELVGVGQHHSHGIN